MSLGLSVNELERAEVRIIQFIQHRAFVKEVSCIESNKERCNWFEKKRNLNVGDNVVVVGDGLPRTCWLLGRIESALPGFDGLLRTVKVRTEMQCSSDRFINWAS